MWRWDNCLLFKGKYDYINKNDDDYDDDDVEIIGNSES